LPRLVPHLSTVAAALQLENGAAHQARDMAQLSLSGIRPFRSGQTVASDHESSVELEHVPFLTQEQTFDHSPVLEDGVFDDTSGDATKSPAVTLSRLDEPVSSFDQRSSQLPTWRWPRSTSSLTQMFGGRRTVVRKEHIVKRSSLHKSPRSTPLRRILRLLALALMLL